MKHFILLLLSCSALMFSSCSQDEDEDGVIDAKDKCPHTPLGVHVNKDGCPFDKKLGNIHLYVDNSASMAGYFNKDAAFKTIVSDLVSKVDKNVKPIDISFISENISKYPHSVRQFSSDLATTKMADKDGYQLHDMIANIASKSDSNDVSILISDCILSFPDEAIKKNREINKLEAPNALKNNIFLTFSDLKKKGLAASIYAFRSNFFGTYFDYQDNRLDCSNQGVSRPFYILIIAHKDLLGAFTSQLEEISTFKPDKSLHFGLSEDPVNTFDIIPQVERKGTWMKCKSGIKDIELTKTNPVEFCAVFNLSNLPLYAKDIKYLQENIKVASSGAKVTFEVKEKSALDRSKLTSEPQVALLTKATHAMIFEVKAMDLSQASINVSLPLYYDTWYIDWSCLDDRDISKAENKTFAFEYFISGIKEAYDTKNKDYINFLITLNK